MNLLVDCQNPVGFLCSGKLSCCAARVEPKNTVPEIVLRSVAVSMNNGLNPRELGPQPLLQGVGRASLSRMVDADLEIPCLDDVNCWQFLPYIWPIDIAVDTSEEADLAQLVNQPLAREIPCVNGHIGAGYLVKDLPR